MITSKRGAWFILTPPLILVAIFMLNSLLQFFVIQNGYWEEYRSLTRNGAIFLSILTILIAIPSIVYGIIHMAGEGVLQKSDYKYTGKPPYKNRILFYFSARGRVGRFEYFILSYLLPFPFFFFLWMISLINDPLVGLLVVLLSPFSCIFLYLSIVMTIKRFHDLDHSGWYMLWFIVPIINIIFPLILLFHKWTNGDNRFWKNIYREKDIVKIA